MWQLVALPESPKSFRVGMITGKWSLCRDNACGAGVWRRTALFHQIMKIVGMNDGHATSVRIIARLSQDKNGSHLATSTCRAGRTDL